MVVGVLRWPEASLEFEALLQKEKTVESAGGLTDFSPFPLFLVFQSLPFSS